MAKYKPRFSKQTFPGYLKLGLALQITKNGLQCMVKKESEEFHQSILQKLPQKCICPDCNMENILECPTVGYCDEKPCTIHFGKWTQPRPCPNHICNTIRDSIKEAHRSEPSWRNTDVRRWGTDSLQITKCFLPSCCYENVQSYADVDLNGILHVFINNKHFEGKMSDILSEKENVCAKALEVEQIYRRCNSLAISKTELHSYVNVLTDLLSDAKCLLLDQSAKESVNKLSQLKTDTLTISTNVINDILDDSIASISNESNVKKHMLLRATGRNDREQVKRTDSLKLKVLKECRSSFSNRNRKIKSSQLESFVSEQTSSVNILKELTMKLVESQENEMLEDKTAIYFPKTMMNIDDETHIAVERPVTNGGLLSRSSTSENNYYQQLKAELQSDLVCLYRERHSTLPLSPLIQKNKAPLLDFYVTPSLKVVDLEKGLLDGKEYPMYKDVNFLSDIFMKNEKVCKNLCLTSQPGTGKTSFLKYLALLWCQAQSPEKDAEKYFTKSDLDCLRQYAFLFLIPLRDARQECEQDVMIKNLLISQLGQEHVYTYHFLESVLHEEKCVILMDGLDEWRHPKQTVKLCRSAKSNFPHIKVRLNCTTLYTTRPWILNKFRTCNDKIDQHLEMQGLGKNSSEKLIHNVIAYLNSKNKSKKEMPVTDFLVLLSTKGLQKFESNPVILMQLLCLWYEGTDPGESQCEIYSNMLELLLRRAGCSFKGKQQMKLPPCFLKNPICKKNARLLFSIGKLAFGTLFPGRRESALVFDRSIAREYLDDQQIQRCLEAGIISQSEEQGKIATEKISLTFLHKTFQEFFAALSIVSTSRAILKKEVERKMFENQNTVQDVLQLETILLFVSGFSPRITSVLTQRTREIVEHDRISKHYRTNIGTLFLDSRVCMNDYCSMIAKCVRESNSNKHTDIEKIYVEDVFIDKKCADEKYTSALKCLIEMNVECIKSLSINVKQALDDERVKIIMEQLHVRDIRSLEKMYVWGEIPHVLLQSLIQQSRHTIKCIELWGMTLFLEDVSRITTTMNLEGLSFLSVAMPHVVLENLMSHIRLQTQLRQLCLQDIECTDHSQNCPGYALELSEQAKPALLLLDKVNLTRISIEAESLIWCVVEWIPLPGALKSLLTCLRNAPHLERFDCDGPASSEDNTSIFQTVSTFAKLEYLRLRNVEMNTSDVGFAKMFNLKRVHFVNVTLESKVMENIIEQIECLDSTVTVCMDNCKITPFEKYGCIKERMRLSGLIDVLFDKEGSHGQLYFKTTQKALESSSLKQNLTQTGTTSGTFLREHYVFEDVTEARLYADNLMKKSEVPDQNVLNELCKMLGKRDKITSRLCQDICVLIKRKNSKIASVWPSFLCSTLGTSSENHIVFVVSVREKLLSSEIKEIGYVLKERVLGKYSEEARHVMFEKIFKESQLSLSETEKLKKCINMHASKLMKRHSLLSVIAPSHVRSRGYGTYRFKVQREPCIALYVHTKNYIPLDEEPFQNKYDGIPVDVREGNFEIHPGAQLPTEFHENLKMGCQIGNETDTAASKRLSGTLGGFIDHPLYGLCGFTCAHVLLHTWGMEELKRVGTIKWPGFDPFGTVYQPGETNHGIGRLVQSEYAEGTEERSGIEVALFQIERRHPNAGDFPGMQTQGQVDELRFDSGKVHGCSRMNNDQVVKFGCSSYKTVGEFVLNEAATSVRTDSQKILVNNCQITLHNQLEVRSKQLHPFERSGKFSDFGDSGSLVFMKGSDGEYACVGMVEGGTSFETTIVTPITPILEAFNVSRLKNFETEKLANELRNIRSDIKKELNTLEARVNSIDTSLQSFGNSIMQELRELKSKMSSQPQQN